MREPKTLAEAEYYEEEDFLSALALKSAVWQYLMDHSKVTSTGSVRIFFITKSQNQFWGHVNARLYGKYKRNDLSEITQKQYRQILAVNKVLQRNDYIAEVSNRVEEVDPLRRKIALWLYRKARDYLFSR